MRDIILVTAMLLGTTAAAANDQAADSLVVDLPDIVVSAKSGAPPATDRTILGPVQIEVRDPGSLADLGLALPSARVATNSRGDSHVMIRGAPER
ncbi:hypothetical protein DRQ50_12405, partial [bacterium]